MNRTFLSPLYGATSEETNKVRSKDGRGMLAPDCFFDPKVLNYPQAVVALLVLWNRNHNVRLFSYFLTPIELMSRQYIARQLLLHNEEKKWIDPSNFDETMSLRGLLSDQDNEIFGLARLINCIQFMNMVETDFLRVIAGHGIAENPDVARGRKPGTESQWKIGTQYRSHALSTSKRGDGCTATFQLLYEVRSNYSTNYSNNDFPKQSIFASQDEAAFYEIQKHTVSKCLKHSVHHDRLTVVTVGKPFIYNRPQDLELR